MNNILSWFSFFNEELYFDENFTPLYHITNSLEKILEDDQLKVGHPARGPKGICFTRSKFFSHGFESHGRTPRIILNREKLIRNGYRIFPLDEWSLRKINDDESDSNKSQNWSNQDIIKRYHFGKSNFPKIKDGKRPISHNITGLPGKQSGLEIEFEERILKNIKNVGKFIYAFNFKDEQEYERYKMIVNEYRKKYPSIKILFGLTNFKEISN